MIMNDRMNKSHLSTGLGDTAEGTQRDSRQALLGIRFSLLEGVCSVLFLGGGL